MDTRVVTGWPLVDTVLTASTESWQQATTADNLRIIERAHEERGDDVSWLSQIINEIDPVT